MTGERFERYTESIYLVTTTISLVGYGDFKAFNDDSGEWLFEMLCLILLMSFGNYSFASITK